MVIFIVGGIIISFTFSKSTSGSQVYVPLSDVLGLIMVNMLFSPGGENTYLSSSSAITVPLNRHLITTPFSEVEQLSVIGCPSKVVSMLEDNVRLGTNQKRFITIIKS